METFLEFINGNLHKHYPLSDSVSAESVDGTKLPDTFIADLRLVVQDTNSVTIDQDTIGFFYISSVRVYGSQASIVIGYNATGTPFNVASVTGIPLNLSASQSVADRTFQLESMSDVVLYGSVVIGDTQDIAKFPGNLVFTANTAQLNPVTITKITNVATALVVGNTRLVGDIVLEAGDNVILDVDADTNTVRISYGNPDTLTFSNATDLFNYVISVYGSPIKSINGVLPDPADGHITISAGNQCTTITGSADATITITNRCSDPCDDKALLNELYEKIGTLNLNYSRLQQLYASIASNTSMLIARLSALAQNQLEAEIDIKADSADNSESSESSES